MAGYNEIQVGRYNRLLAKLLSMKGGAVMNSLQPELVPSLSFFMGVEGRYLESWDLFGAFSTITGVAAQNSATRLRNPASSNVIAVVQKLTVWEVTADQYIIDVNAQAADLTNVIAGSITRMDRRGRSNSTLQLSNGNNAAAGTTAGAAAIPANQSYEFVAFENQEIPLLPGDALTIRTNQLNVICNVMLFWRERFLEESERT